ncbi:MAG: acyl-CoA dehydrogenase [Burkholderiales bacterium]|nr:acyl-CoA dehydrogenase [Burkholderiales bacterium]
MTLTSIVHCLQAPAHAADTPTFDAWAARWFAAPQASLPPIDRAIHMAFAADRVAWAFASAYQAALRALIPQANEDRLLSLCVTEKAGNRPRDIETRIELLPEGAVRVHGSKRWAMIGDVPTTLLVVGVTEAAAPDSVPRLRVVQVPVGTAGLTIQHTQPTRFVPEVPHCAVELNAVALGPEALLPGDGYTQYMKPFRTLEDVYVAAATLAYLMREARANRWPTDYIERLSAALTAVQAIAQQAPLEPVTHILLSGALQIVRGLRDEATALWADARDASAERWRRDCALFEVADTARRLRRDRAWENLP